MKLSLNKFSCNLLLILFFLYFSQGVIFPSGGFIGPVLILFIFLISFVYLFKVVFGDVENSSIIFFWTAFYFIVILNFMFRLVFSSDVMERDFSMLRQILINFLPFFPAYYLAKKGVLTKRHLILFLFALLPILSISFYRSLSVLQVETGKDTVVSNVIYLIVGLLPFLFLIKRRVISFGILLFIFVLVIQSNKRAAILISLLAFITLIYQSLYLSPSRSKLWGYLMIFIFIMGSIYFIYDLYQQNIYLQGRINLAVQGHSSGRDRLIVALFDAWYHSGSFVNYIFGLGFNSNEYNTTLGNVAHNDWIDVLASYGLIGIFLFVALWVALIKQVFDSSWNKNKRLNYILILIVAFVASLLFRWYISPFPFMNALLLPYLLATKDTEN